MKEHLPAFISVVTLCFTVRCHSVPIVGPASGLRVHHVGNTSYADTVAVETRNEGTRPE